MKERMEELIQIINEADYNYHTLDNPTITDTIIPLIIQQ